MNGLYSNAQRAIGTEYRSIGARRRECRGLRRAHLTRSRRRGKSSEEFTSGISSDGSGASPVIARGSRTSCRLSAGEADGACIRDAFVEAGHFARPNPMVPGGCHA